MTSITLLLPCHCSNEYYNECNMAVIHVDRAMLLTIKQRMAIARTTKAGDAGA